MKLPTFSQLPKLPALSTLVLAAAAVWAAFALIGGRRQAAREAVYEAEAHGHFALAKLEHAAIARLVAQRDSALATADRVAGERAAARGALGRLRDSLQVATAVAASRPIDQVAAGLGLRAIGPDLWGGDSLAVRALDRIRQRALAAAATGRLLERQLAQADTEATALRRALVAATARGDRLQSYADTADVLIKRGLALQSCHILWLLPCPSRAESAVLGAVATLLTIHFVKF